MAMFSDVLTRSGACRRPIAPPASPPRRHANTKWHASFELFEPAS